MVDGVFGDVSCKLGYFNFTFQLSFEASKQHLSLRRLKAIDDTRDGALVVVVAKLNVFLVDEVAVFNTTLSRRLDVVHKVILGRRVQPFFAIIGSIFLEDHIDQIRTFGIPGDLGEVNFMQIQIREVLLRFRALSCGKKCVLL